MESTRFAGDVLREDLLNAIRTGGLKPGERIPSFRSLARRYGVSLNTVQRVVSELVRQGVLESSHGRGTFVSRPKKLSAKTDFSVGIFGRTSGHFYGDLTECLCTALAHRGAQPLVHDMDRQYLESVRNARLREMTDTDCSAIIVEGSLGTNPTHGDHLSVHLKRVSDRVRNLIVVNRWEDPERPPGSYYLFDYCDAGFQIARYLFGLGHRRIIFNAFGMPPVPGTYEEDIYRGMCDFFNQQSVPVQIELFRDPQPGVAAFDQERFERLLASPDRPTAVVLVADFQARAWLERLARHGIGVPDDCSVIGFFNTPWAERVPVPLTSVQLNIEKLVLSVVNQILASRDSREPVNEQVQVGASIVVRGSCGPVQG